jgi:hypothetical protein
VENDVQSYKPVHMINYQAYRTEVAPRGNTLQNASFLLLLKPRLLAGLLTTTYLNVFPHCRIEEPRFEWEAAVQIQNSLRPYVNHPEAESSLPQWRGWDWHHEMLRVSIGHSIPFHSVSKHSVAAAGIHRTSDRSARSLFQPPHACMTIHHVVKGNHQTVGVPELDELAKTSSGTNLLLTNPSLQSSSSSTPP